MAAVMHDPRNSRLTNTVGPAIRIRRLRVNMGRPRSKFGATFASPTYATETGRRDQPCFKYRDPTHAAQVRGGVWPRCVVDEEAVPHPLRLRGTRGAALPGDKCGRLRKSSKVKRRGARGKPWI